MNRELLETLVLDQCCGALPPETSALLDAYLQRDEAARRIADSCRRATNAVAGALGQPAATQPADLPPFPARRVRHALAGGTSVRWLGRATGIAAVLVIGAGLGMLFRGAPIPSGAETGVPSHPVVNAAEPAALQGGFWSVQRIVAQRTPERRGGGQLVWTSVTKTPHIVGGEL